MTNDGNCLVRASVVLLCTGFFLCGYAAEPTATDKPAADTAQTQSTAEYARQKYLQLAKSRGYKTQKRDGQVVYCRSEAPIGSRFEHLTCFTEDVLILRFKQEEEALAQSSRARQSVGTQPGQ